MAASFEELISSMTIPDPHALQAQRDRSREKQIQFLQRVVLASAVAIIQDANDIGADHVDIDTLVIQRALMDPCELGANYQDHVMACFITPDIRAHIHRYFQSILRIIPLGVYANRHIKSLMPVHDIMVHIHDALAVASPHYSFSNYHPGIIADHNHLPAVPRQFMTFTVSWAVPASPAAQAVPCRVPETDGDDID